MSEILQHTAHRPWPLPRAPWQGFMRWTDLAFLHWPVPEEVIRPLVPSGLTIDTFEGSAWVGVVPFRMENTRYRWAPPIPTASTFPEVNVRTYVRSGSKAGVWFHSLDAASRLAVWGARTLLNLPYHHAAMKISVADGEVAYSSERSGSAAALRGHYRSSGPVYHAAPGTLDHWLTERYCLFGAWPRGTLYRVDVHHLPWPLQPGTADIRKNSLAAAAGIALPDTPPLVHVARRLDVFVWPPLSLTP